MPLFYRVEHKETRTGCYNTFISLAINTLAEPKHPLPHDDTALMQSFFDANKTYNTYLTRFGFKSLEQFKAWFYNHEELQILSANQFHLAIYDITHIYEGDSQSCIDGTEHKIENIKECIELTLI